MENMVVSLINAITLLSAYSILAMQPPSAAAVAGSPAAASPMVPVLGLQVPFARWMMGVAALAPLALGLTLIDAWL